MKRISLMLAAALCCVLTACEYDDTELRNQIHDHEVRMEALRVQCSRMNTNLSGLQGIVTALQERDYITSLVPIELAGKEVGYTISFAEGEPVSIYHGKDANVPSVGVKQDSGDSLYYWTLDSEWLLDANGRKVRAVGIDGPDGLPGADGADGLIPELKIEEGYWYMKVGTGEWQRLGAADGAAGENGDAVFSDIQVKAEEVIFTLGNAETIVLPMLGDRLVITIPVQICGMDPLSTVNIPYTVTGATDKALVQVYGPAGWNLQLENKSDGRGVVKVTPPDPVTEEEIVLIVYDGEDRMTMGSFKVVPSQNL